MLLIENVTGLDSGASTVGMSEENHAASLGSVKTAGGEFYSKGGTGFVKFQLPNGEIASGLIFCMFRVPTKENFVCLLRMEGI